MSPSPKILAFAGSARQGSFNQTLVKIAATGAETAGADVTVFPINEVSGVCSYNIFHYEW